MKLILAAALIALAFTTGFTCSKNTPPVEEVPMATPAPTEVPADGTATPAEAPPADAPPADGATN